LLDIRPVVGHKMPIFTAVTLTLLLLA